MKYTLEELTHLINTKILKTESPYTCLTPQNDEKHAWVRDNLYILHSTFSLHQAYKNRAQIHQDNQNDKFLASKYSRITAKGMRSILTAYSKQVARLELRKSAKRSDDFENCQLHVKFHFESLEPVETDEYSHFQLDVVALYLLTLAQFTSAGLEIVYSLILR